MLRIAVAIALVLAGVHVAAPHDNPEELEELEALRQAVDNYVCADEYEVALAFSVNGEREDGHVSILAGWSGSPHVVNVSSLFDNADALLKLVEDEAALINEVLGYRIVVPGNIIPLPEVTSRDDYNETFLSLLPPPGQAHILCCDQEADYAGFSAHVDRLIVLNKDDVMSEGAIIHELYHLFGFGHPDESTGVPMSDVMMWDAMSISTASDLAKLACIFDDAPIEEPTDPVVVSSDEASQPALPADWQAEHEQTMADNEQVIDQAMSDLCITLGNAGLELPAHCSE